MVEHLFHYDALSSLSGAFEKRVAKAWEIFEKCEPSFRQRLDKSPKTNKDRNIDNDCQKIIGIALSQEVCLAQKVNDRYRLILTGTGSLLRLFEDEYFKEHAPQNVLNNWDIIVGLPKENLQKAQLENKLTIYNEAKLWVEEKNGIFYTKAFTEIEHKVDIGNNPSLRTLLSEEWIHWTKYMVLRTVISEFLGETSTLKFIEISDILDKPLDAPSMKLTEIAAFFKAHGIDVHESSKDILNKETTYTFQPAEEHKNSFYREDVISGKTMCMPLLIDFERGDEKNINRLEADGAVAGYIYYGLENFTGNNKEKEITEFRESIKRRLEEKFGEDTLKITGEAHGLTNDYIDLFLWNPNTVFNGWQELFKGLPVPYAGFQVFRRNSKGMCLTGKENWEKRFNFEALEPKDVLGVLVNEFN